VLIIAGHLLVEPRDRATFLEANRGVALHARSTLGCLDFVQAADPLDEGRINIFERWETEADLLSFRGDGRPSEGSPPILVAHVTRYDVTAIGEP